MRVFAFVVSAITLLQVGDRAAAAEPVTLRMASLVPDGTAWARELKAVARDIEARTHGQVRVKWYLGGIAGDENVVPERIRRGLIDGEAAGVSCANLAPSLKVLRVAGLFRRREEAHAVIEHLRPALDAEFRKAGLVLLGVTWFGSEVVFSRRPVRTFDDLKRTRLWTWNLDPVWGNEMKMLGLNVVPLSVEEAGRAYDEGRVDGFLALPNAALAYQWSTRARYFANLNVAAMAGCTVISNQAFDALPLEQQTAVRAAGVKATLRFEDISAALEDSLLGRLFEKQGTHEVPVSAVFRADFLEAARNARENLPDSVVPRGLVTQVQTWLSDFRAEQRSVEPRR